MNNRAPAKQSTITPSAPLFEKVAHVSLDAIIFTDMEGRITYVNPAFVRMWEHESAGDVIGEHYTAFVPSPEPADAVLAAIVRDGRWVGQSHGRRKSGASFPIDVSAALIVDEAGAPCGMMASVADLSDTRRAETALRESEEKVPLARGIRHRPRLHVQPRGPVSVRQRRRLADARTRAG